MPSTDENKPTGKPGQRNRKAERNRKPDSAQSPRPDQRQDAKEQIGATVASTDTSSIATTAPTDTAPIAAAAPTNVPPIEAVAPTETSPIGATASAKAASVNFRTIANAYGEYSLKSFENTKSFVEKLTGVRSIEKAVEVQTEFAKQACETFVAESQKINELHKEFAKQMFKPLQTWVTKTI